MVDKHRGNPKRKRTAVEAASRAAEMTNKAAAVAERKEARARFAEEVAHVGSAVARELALPKILQVILDESTAILRSEHGVLIVRTTHGLVCANAGVDQSNVPGEEMVALLPADPDGSARALRASLELVGHRNLPDDLKERLSRVSLDAPSLVARAASTRQA